MIVMFLYTFPYTSWRSICNCIVTRKQNIRIHTSKYTINSYCSAVPRAYKKFFDTIYESKDCEGRGLSKAHTRFMHLNTLLYVLPGILYPNMENPDLSDYG